MSNDPIEEVVQKGLDRWDDCEGLAQMSLLRLALIREFVRRLQFEKSQALATGKKEKVQKIKEWENRLDLLREASSLAGSLRSLLTENQSRAKRKRVIPEALFNSLESNPFTQYDRKWEAALAGEAAFLGWDFWRLDTWINIALIEEWSDALSKTLWPHGIILLSAGAGQRSDEILSSEEDAELWRGHWVIVIDPGFKNPMELSLNLSRWPGSGINPPSPPIGNSFIPRKFFAIYGNRVKFVDFLIQLLQAQSETLKRLAAFFGEDELLELLEAAGDQPQVQVKTPAKTEEFLQSISPAETTHESSAYSKLESSVMDMQLPAVLEFHLWAYPYYRTLIEGPANLNSPLGASIEPLVQDAINQAQEWIRSLPIRPELGTAAERVSQIPWLKFRSNVLSQAGIRPITSVK